MSDAKPTADESPGLRCPKCASALSVVTNTRRLPTNAVRRYRECVHCGHSWRTLELTELSQPVLHLDKPKS